MDVLHFGEFITDFYGHRRAAKSQKVRSIRRLQHDVGPDAFDAFGRFGQQTAGQPDDEDDQGNLDGDSHRANQRAQRTVKQIAGDQFTHHGFLFSVGSPTGTSSEPAGCSSLNRSAGISSFIVTFVTCKSSL